MILPHHYLYISCSEQETNLAANYQKHQQGGPIPDDLKRDDPEVYQIKIKRHLEERWVEWFGEMTFSHEKDGTTTLYGSLPDQTALHSILRKIRDLNLQLLLIKLIKLDAEDEILTNSIRGVQIDD